jgi:hypothetical protein
MTREVTALVLDVPEDSFDVTVTPDLTEPQRLAQNDLERAKASYQKAIERMAERQRALATRFKKDGLTVKDSAVVMNLSHQRVSQLTQGTVKKSPSRSRSRVLELRLAFAVAPVQLSRRFPRSLQQLCRPPSGPPRRGRGCRCAGEEGLWMILT